MTPPIAVEHLHHTPAQIARIRDVAKGLPAPQRSMATTIGLLATSGLDTRHVMRAVPDLLRTVMPIDIAGFFWANADGDMVDAFVETPHFLRADVILSCLRFQAEAKANWPSFQDNVLAGAGAGYLLPYQTAAFYRSAHYAQVYAPIGIEHITDVVVHDGSRPHGAFLLMRSSASGPFQPEELQGLRVLVPLLAYAFSLPVNPHTPATRRYDAGTLVVSSSGDIDFCDLHAHQVLWMLTRDPATPMRLDGDDSLPTLVRQCCEAGIARARVRGSHRETRQNHWGSFELKYEACPRTATVAVQVSQVQPYPLYLARKLVSAQLPAMRLMVAWLLTESASRKDIARALDISTDTVAEHIRAVFEHFGVGTTVELVLKLSQ